MKKLPALIILLLIFATLNVRASEAFTGEFTKISTTNQITIKSVRPRDCDEAQFMITSVLEEYIDQENHRLYASCNYVEGSTPSVEEIAVGVYAIDNSYSQEHVLLVTYEEPDTNKITLVNSEINKLKQLTEEETWEPKNGYLLSDLYLINYMKTNNKIEFYEPGAATSAFNFSKEIINLTNGGNIKYKVNVAAGNDFSTGLFQYALGRVTILYNNVAYKAINTGVTELNIIYADKNATDFVKSAQDRINDYLGSNEVSITSGGTLASLSYEECTDIMPYGPEGCVNYRTITYNDESLFDPDKLFSENYYNLSIGGKTYRFVIYKGEAEDLTYPTYLGSDLLTTIRITSNDSAIPLDTSLTVSDANSERLNQILGSDQYTAFDISLYSNFKNTKIERTDSGNFMVRIPVPTSLNNKNITVYYLNSNDEKEEHTTTVSDGYASFETNHFSTYILAEKELTANPNTNDNIYQYVFIGLISLISITVLSVNNKKLLIRR